jgi:hypothetical protein
MALVAVLDQNWSNMGLKKGHLSDWRVFGSGSIGYH